MEFQPLFRELRLSLLNDQDVKYALDILEGKSTVSQVAEILGQDEFSFNGDGDIMILSYTRGESDEALAERIMGDRADRIVRKYLLHAIKRSKASIELVFRCCNLSTESIVLLAAAFTSNTSFVGFSITGNYIPDMGRRALKRACIETRAPITWFQGRAIPESLLSQRQAFQREHPINGSNNSRHSPKSKDDQGRRLSSSAPLESMEESPLDMRIRSSSSSEENERLKWREETMNKLRRLHPHYSEEDLCDLVANMELNSLQTTIDRLLYETMRENDNPAYTRRNSITFRTSSVDPIA